jgi:hypothetical protein
VLDPVRAAGADAAGKLVVRPAAAGGEPLRCCLRRARPGEGCVHFGHEPPRQGPGSPYREVGAVLLPAGGGGGAADLDDYPPDRRGRPQVLRTYDARGWIHPATTTHDGSDPVAALRAVLTVPGVVEVHSRNVAYGCYRFTARVRRTCR